MLRCSAILSARFISNIVWVALTRSSSHDAYCMQQQHYTATAPGHMHARRRSPTKFPCPLAKKQGHPAFLHWLEVPRISSDVDSDGGERCGLQLMPGPPIIAGAPAPAGTSLRGFLPPPQKQRFQHENSQPDGQPRAARPAAGVAGHRARDARFKVGSAKFPSCTCRTSPRNLRKPPLYTYLASVFRERSAGMGRYGAGRKALA